VDNWKNITNSQNSVRKKKFGGTFTVSNCHIIGLDTGSLVLIVFGISHDYYSIWFNRPGILTELSQFLEINVICKTHPPWPHPA
jgi:hypothetical protein